jgi:hypothetical protein
LGKVQSLRTQIRGETAEIWRRNDDGRIKYLVSSICFTEL